MRDKTHGYSKLTESVNGKRLLIVEDSDIDFEIMNATLNLLFEVHRDPNGKDTLAKSEALKPDLFLLDYQLPNADGLEICQQLRSSPTFKETPIIMVTGDSYASLESMFWQNGCDDFIRKPFSTDTLVHRVIHQLKFYEMQDKLKQAAMTDSLTQTFNRRYLEKTMAQIVNRTDVPELSILLIDVDFFKKYNDKYGHFAGDLALKTVADVLKNNLARTTDFVTRFGGEEFVVTLPHTHASGAQNVIN